ncbi:MAG: class I SAM-dependent methyltransferase, partial [Phycisphaera sp.]|nr:class I SAM-dependent methyltransferase [Phycisphaera sp.]
VHHSLILFESTWSRAFIEHVASAIVEGGTLLLPRPKSGRMPVIDLEDYADLLGEATGSIEIGDKEYLSHTVPARNTTPSTLRWAIDRQNELLRGEEDRGELIRRYEPGTRPEDLEPLMDTGCTLPSADPTLHARADPARAAELFAYFHGAVAPKMAMLRRLAIDLDLDRPLHHVDVGGGMGNLGAELVLDERCPVESSLNVEFDAARLIMGRSLLQTYDSRLSGKWTFHPAFAQDYDFQVPAELITMLGALLYVPREELVPCLDRAWEALRPGGAMVVYEHIKHPRFHLDFDVMFDRGELESILGRFGDCSYVSGSSLVPMDPQTIEDKSVYRILRKPG